MIVYIKLCMVAGPLQAKSGCSYQSMQFTSHQVPDTLYRGNATSGSTYTTSTATQHNACKKRASLNCCCGIIPIIDTHRRNEQSRASVSDVTLHTALRTCHRPPLLHLSCSTTYRASGASLRSCESVGIQTREERYTYTSTVIYSINRAYVSTKTPITNINSRSKHTPKSPVNGHARSNTRIALFACSLLSAPTANAARRMQRQVYIVGLGLRSTARRLLVVPRTKYQVRVAETDRVAYTSCCC